MSGCSCIAVVTIPFDYETGRYRRGLIPICISDTDECGQQIEWRCSRPPQRWPTICVVSLAFGCEMCGASPNWRNYPFTPLGGITLAKTSGVLIVWWLHTLDELSMIFDADIIGFAKAPRCCLEMATGI